MSSCASHVTIAYSDLPENNNSLLLKPSLDMPKTSVVVNGTLLVDQKFIKDVKITGLPDGSNSFQVSSGSAVYSENLNVQRDINLNNGEEKTELIKSPTISNGYWTSMSLTWIGIIALILL